MSRWSKLLTALSLAVAPILLFAFNALAQMPLEASQIAGAVAEVPAAGPTWMEIAARVLAATLGLGLAAGLGALGQGKAAAGALDGIARQPAAGGRIFTTLILSLALIESLVIYVLIISFIVLP